ncbi:MAG: hypothetical protein KF901_10065 [Myxococcales bacterium]|nr:hypothetical protein [Myxococcales bacterium]
MLRFTTPPRLRGIFRAPFDALTTRLSALVFDLSPLDLELRPHDLPDGPGGPEASTEGAS